MTAYSIILGPVAAILILDHWWLHQRKNDIVALYHREGWVPLAFRGLTELMRLIDDSIYFYNHYGINPRALIAFIVGVAPCLLGFISSINTAVDPGVGKRPYAFGWLLGFTATGFTYRTMSLVWKPHKTFIEWAIKPDEVYDSESDGVETAASEKGHIYPTACM